MLNKLKDKYVFLMQMVHYQNIDMKINYMVVNVQN